MIVHALLGGWTLCQNKEVCDKPPSEWPEDHYWTYATDLENITCEECKSLAARWKEKKNEIQ